jgi:glycerol-3-phosphate dehydrogenase
VLIRDEITGEMFPIKPKVIVNASGAWIDHVNEAFGLREQYIGGTKGSHLVLNVPELKQAIGTHEFFFENKDGRIVLILPFYDKVIVGTSDLPVTDVDHVACTREEEDYFIEFVSHIFPNIKINREDIVFRFSGVRPLEFSKAKTTGQISRDHTIKHDLFGGIPVLSLVGGKWTSFRAFSEQTTDEVLKLLGKSRKTGTEQLIIRGGDHYPATGKEWEMLIRKISGEAHLEAPYVEELILRYGSDAMTVAENIERISNVPLKSLPNWTRGEVAWLVKTEDVLHLDDLFLRRSSIAWLGNLNRAVLNEFGEILADELGWSEEEKTAEIQRTLELMRENHGVLL